MKAAGTLTAPNANQMQVRAIVGENGSEVKEDHPSFVHRSCSKLQSYGLDVENVVHGSMSRALSMAMSGSRDV